MMKDYFELSRFDQPTTYLLKIKGRLDASWKEWFDNMEIVVSEDEDGDTVTSMTGLVVDQVALHGLLARIQALNLQLLSVQLLGGLPPTSDRRNG